MAFEINSTAVRGEWNTPTSPNGIILSYRLYYSGPVGSSEEPERYITEPAGDTDVYQVTVPGLEEFVTYNLRVSAFTRIGEGNSTGTMSVVTDPDRASPPTPVSATVINSTAIRVSWGYPTDPRGSIFGYLISNSLTVTLINLTLDNRNDMNNQSHVFTELMPFTNYTFRVAAYSFSDQNGTIIEHIGIYTDIVMATTTEDGEGLIVCECLLACASSSYNQLVIVYIGQCVKNSLRIEDYFMFNLLSSSFTPSNVCTGNIEFNRSDCLLGDSCPCQWHDHRLHCVLQNFTEPVLPRADPN